MPRCIYCGANVDGEMPICPTCGAPLLHRRNTEDVPPQNTSTLDAAYEVKSSPTKKSKKKLPIIIAVVVLLILSISMCSGSSSDPIEGEWIIYEVLNGDEVTKPYGIEEFAFTFNSDGTGEMSLIEGGVDSFSWEYTENLDGDSSDVRAYTLSYASGNTEIVFIDQGNLFVLYDEDDIVFIFESVE